MEDESNKLRKIPREQYYKIKKMMLLLGIMNAVPNCAVEKVEKSMERFAEESFGRNNLNK